MVLDLGSSPLANEYPSAPLPESQDTFPLYLVRCSSCEHVQLPVVVDPDRLFRHYAYQSGTSIAFRDHLAHFADDVRPDNAGCLVVEIGSNDGTLLAEYKNLGYRILGVDPAQNLAQDANARGIHTIPGFFSLALAQEIGKAHGSADLIVANNVFAHADDLTDIVRGVDLLLAETGRFVFEVGYLPDVIELGLFDVIYHEHLSHHHLGPLLSFFVRHGLELYDAHRVLSQGGSIRCFVRRSAPEAAARRTDRLTRLLEAETPDAVNMARIAHKVTRTRSHLRQILDDCKSRNEVVAGYGAPAKLTTLMCACRLTTDDIEFIADDNPLKIGKCTPGTFIPISSVTELASRKPDALLIFSWNFADEIMRRCRAMEFNGRFIVPAPEVRVA